MYTQCECHGILVRDTLVEIEVPFIAFDAYIDGENAAGNVLDHLGWFVQMARKDLELGKAIVRRRNNGD